MKTLSIGAKAPEFSREDASGNIHTLADYAGKWLLIYFYPKDSTPGCTTEACAFRDAFELFGEYNAAVVGVSKDSVKSHGKFAESYKLPFPILSDPSHAMIENYGAWQEKKFMGRTYMGIARISYLIDPNGKVKKVYEKVDTAKHAQEVLFDIRAFQKKGK